MQRLLKRAREWVEGGKAHDQAKAQPRKEQALKNEKPKNSSCHKKPRMVAKCVDKPPNHNEHVSSRQILDVHGNEAYARSRHHQPIPSQYRRWWSHESEVRGHGLAVGEGENLFWGSCSGSFGGNVLLGWHATQRKQGWAETTRCMPWRIRRERERESTHTIADKSVMASKQRK